MVKFELKPTTLLGKVVGENEDLEAIGMAKVQISETGDYIFSLKEFVRQQGREWNYRFVGIDANNASITLLLSAKGYATTQKEIHLEPGEINSLDFQLVSQ